MFQGFFLIVCRYPGVSKDEIIGFGSRGHVQNPEIMEMRVFGFSHKQIEQFWNQIEAEMIPRSFQAYLFPKKYYTNC